jgi:hypothetical protein
VAVRCGFVNSVLSLFFVAAYLAYLPKLVHQEHLVEGDSKPEINRSMAQVAPPGIAGAAIQLLTAPVALSIDASGLVVCAAFIGSTRKKEDKPPERQSTAFSQVRGGPVVFVDNPNLRAVTACRATGGMFG